MARQKKAEPEVHIDDLHPRNDGFTQTYNGTWTEQGIIAHLTLDIVDRGRWQPGQRLKDAYELVSLNPTTVSGRPLGSVQEEIARVLLRKLRERMLDLLKIAGWSRVASTRDGQPIYQYRPAPRLSAPAQHMVLEQEVGIVSDLVEHQSRTYAVYGDGTKEEKKAAKKNGQKPAYTRTVSTKTVTFACSRCGNTVAEEHLPGAKPQYCKPCAEIVRKEKTLERVKRYYAAHPDKHNGSTKKTVN